MQGINVKESNGEILVGIQIDQFIETLKSIPDKNGWVNIVMTPRTDPHPKGYTHFIRAEKKKL